MDLSLYCLVWVGIIMKVVSKSDIVNWPESHFLAYPNLKDPWIEFWGNFWYHHFTRPPFKAFMNLSCVKQSTHHLVWFFITGADDRDGSKSPPPEDKSTETPCFPPAAGKTPCKRKRSNLAKYFKLIEFCEQQKFGKTLMFVVSWPFWGAPVKKRSRSKFGRGFLTR